MLAGNITANLDNLASLGVIDYDGAAYIAGSRPRFYGAPNAYTSPFVDTPMDYTTFSYNQNRQPTPWWKTLFKGALAIGGLYFGGKLLLKTCKGAKAISPKNWFSSGKKTTPPATPTPPVKTSWFKNIGNSISDFWSNLTKSRYVKIPGRKVRF